MEPHTPSLRIATAEDAPAIGRVHVAAWRETYPGVLPDSMLAGLSVESRVAMWDRFLTDPECPGAIHVAEQGGEVIGFAASGPQRAQRLRQQGFDGEISAIYILRSHQRHGIGSSLMQAMASGMAERGRRALSLWVIRENTGARRFYERVGGRVIDEQEEHGADAVWVEVAYGWPDLTSLLRLTASR